MSNCCVIIPMYNFNGMTEACVKLVKQNAGVDCNIIVIDDGSDHPFADLSVCVMRNYVNEGFTHAVNQGIIECNNNYDYIMILNNDTEPEPDFLKNLVNYMDANPDVAIASSTRKVPKNGDGSYELGGMDWLRGHSKLAWQKEAEPQECEWVPFCSVLIRSSVIRELGLLNKQMKNYCSDNEFCARVRMAGYKIVVVPSSEVVHHRGVTIIENEKKLNLGNDQKIFLEKLSGLQWQTLLNKLPLDIERNIWGRIDFETYNKSV